MSKHAPMLAQVDDHFARFNDQSYAINKISSVGIRTVRPFGVAAAWVYGIVAIPVVILLRALRGAPSGEIVVVALCLAVLIIAAVRVIARSRTRRYQLIFTVAGAEAQVFQSDRLDEIVSLRDRIEEAMARQA